MENGYSTDRRTGQTAVRPSAGAEFLPAGVRAEVLQMQGQPLSASANQINKQCAERGKGYAANRAACSVLGEPFWRPC